jgi:hypothetical protein
MKHNFDIQNKVQTERCFGSSVGVVTEVRIRPAEGRGSVSIRGKTLLSRATEPQYSADIYNANNSLKLTN